MSAESVVKTATFVCNSQADGHTLYTIKATNADGESWNIKKRYRELRELHDQLRARVGDSALPAFPGKKLWGNNDPAFIANRQQQLEVYFEGVLRLERDSRLAPLVRFFGGPAPSTERNQAGLHQNILNTMKKRLLILALPPAPLDDAEMAMRLKKYGSAMQLHVLSQPVDPIHMRTPGFDADPVHLCPTNSDQLEKLCTPPPSGGGSEKQLLGDLLDQLCKVARPKESLVDSTKVVVPFPRVPC
jgi:hypothetical protein